MTARTLAVALLILAAILNWTVLEPWLHRRRMRRELRGYRERLAFPRPTIPVVRLDAPQTRATLGKAQRFRRWP